MYHQFNLFIMLVLFCVRIVILYLVINDVTLPQRGCSVPCDDRS